VLFINSDIIIWKNSALLQSIDFIYKVLVLEVTIRLIIKDYVGINITFEKAQEIIINSIEFSEYMFDE